MKRLAMMILVLAGLATACQGNVFELEVGQCFNDPDSFGEVSSVEIVDCADAHDNEVYHLFDLPDGDFPGAVTVETLGDEGCMAAFAGYVGTDFSSSAYWYQLLLPTADSWDAGDQEVVCYLFEPGVELSGSARNTAR